MDPIVQLTVSEVKRFIDKFNADVILAYTSAIQRAKDNPGTPMPTEVPQIVTLFQEKEFAQAFQDSVQAQFGASTHDLPTELLMPVYDNYIVMGPYQPEPAPVVDNSLVAALGTPIPYKPPRRAVVARFQGKIALGTAVTGPDGTIYKLVDSGSPFNRTGEWEKQ